jgi:hypothetical protein
MEEEQTHNGQKKKDKQRSEKNMHKTNDLYCNNLGPTLYFFFNEIRTCVPLSFLFVICFFLFKCLYQARKVSGHACILGVSILHLSIILIVILESCWYCFDFINWHLTMLCYSWPFVGFRHVTPVCTWSKTTNTTIETGTAYPSDYDATLGFEWVSWYSIFSFLCSVL